MMLKVFLQSNTYHTLKAQIKFNEWKKTMNADISVIKRSGKQELLDINKLHVMVEAACEGLAGVSESQVEMNANIQFYNGITTAEIQQILVNSASNLIDLEHPNYQFVAARLIAFLLYASRCMVVCTRCLK